MHQYIGLFFLSLLLLTSSSCNIGLERPIIEANQWLCQGATCSVELEDQRINKTVLRSRSVLIYMEVQYGSNLWYPLPYLETGGDYFELYSYSYAHRSFRIEKRRSDGLATAPPPTRRFRVLITKASDYSESSDDDGWRKPEPAQEHIFQEAEEVLEFEIPN